ncbi:hypothetical protein CLOP_g518 [Closterium sp. NIES-67]|nr:hypothetical protein CLOP_g518 [Closterium sp. NIES-67]
MESSAVQRGLEDGQNEGAVMCGYLKSIMDGYKQKMVSPGRHMLLPLAIMRCGLTALTGREASINDVLHVLSASAFDAVDKLFAAAEKAGGRGDTVKKQAELRLKAQEQQFWKKQGGEQVTLKELLDRDPALASGFEYNIDTFHVNEKKQLAPDTGFAHGGPRTGPAYAELLESVLFGHGVAMLSGGGMQGQDGAAIMQGQMGVLWSPVGL